jgi:hypothetical protein
LASSGSSSSTGCSSRSRPSSTSDSVAAAVIGLVSEAIRKIASRRSGALLPNDGEPMVSTCSSSP